LNILSVGFEHVIHACEAIFLTQLSEEINDLILLNSVGVQHNSFDVLHVSVVLKCSTVKTNLFTHLSDLFAVVLSENVKFENSFGNIWSAHEIDLENFSLKVSFVLSITLKSFEKESCAFLEFVKFKEYVYNLINLSFWWSIISVSNHF
jgi:hypothetical protein